MFCVAVWLWWELSLAIGLHQLLYSSVVRASMILLLVYERLPPGMDVMGTTMMGCVVAMIESALSKDSRSRNAYSQKHGKMGRR